MKSSAFALTIVIPATLAAPLLPRGYTCNVQGILDSINPIVGLGSKNDYDTCSKACIANSNCQAFSIGGAIPACTLYGNKLSLRPLVIPSSLIPHFYEKGCIAGAATTAAAANPTAKVTTTGTAKAATTTTAKAATTTAKAATTTAKAGTTTTAKAGTTTTAKAGTTTTAKAGTTTTAAAAATTSPKTTTNAPAPSGATSSTPQAATPSTFSTSVTSGSSPTSVEDSAPSASATAPATGSGSDDNDCTAVATLLSNVGGVVNGLTGLSCGTLSGGSESDPVGSQSARSVNDCALACDETTGCTSFGYDGGLCSFFSKKVSDLNISKDYGQYTFYDQACFNVKQCAS